MKNKKLFLITIVSMVLFLAGCNGLGSNNNDDEPVSSAWDKEKNSKTEVSDDNDEQDKITEESTAEKSQNPVKSSEVTAIKHVQLNIAGIDFELPDSWTYTDVSDLVYLGYDIYPPSDEEEKTCFLQVCYVSMDDVKAYTDPDSTAKAVAMAAWNREECSDYKSQNISINGTDVITYECVMTEQGAREKAYLFPVSSIGLLSIFYYCPLSNDPHSDEVVTIVESIDIPEDHVIEEAVTTVKARYMVKEGSISEVINLNGNDTDTSSQENSISENTSIETSGHNYYKGISDDKAALADQVASQIASSIMSNPDYTTDLQRVQAAAKTVADYCAKCTYGTDQERYYRSPYGVFIAGIYTCAGSTRALGRVLDYMGHSWSHVNENQNRHQWAVLTMDGQTGFADGMAGIAGYGMMTNGMVMPDGSTIYFSD